MTEDVDVVLPAPSTEEFDWLKDLRSVNRYRLETSRIGLYGLSVGLEGGMGNDSLVIRKTDKGIIVVMVDGVKSNSDLNVTDERIHAEVVASNLAEKPIRYALDAAKQKLKTANIRRKVSGKQLLSEDPLQLMIAMAEVVPVTDNAFLIQPIGTGDASILALVPNSEGQFDETSLKLVYFNPTANEYKDCIWGERQGRSTSELHLPNPIILPNGSILLLATDGGLDMLFSPQVLKTAGSTFSEEDLERGHQIVSKLLMTSTTIIGDSRREQEMHQAMKLAVEPLIEVLNNRGFEKVARVVLDTVQTGKEKRLAIIPDDVSIVLAKIKGVDEKARVPEIKFSPEVQSLIDAISIFTDQLPLNTDELLGRFGRETAVLLVKELVDQGLTGGLFFADACALVRIDWLPEETKNWFEEQGLVVLDGENIRVHLRHKEDFTIKAGACHEVGQYLLYGTPGGQSIDVNQEPTQVAREAFTPNHISRQSPRGSWAAVDLWTGMRFTVCNAYIAGTGPNARGILVPASKMPIAYWHTESSYEAGRPERNFFIKQGGMHPYAWYGLFALGKYLKGEIPAI